MPVNDRERLDQHTRAILTGLRDANPLVSLGQDTLESLAADDPEDVKAILCSWLETYDTVLGSFEQAATDNALRQHDELLHMLEATKAQTEGLLYRLDGE